MLKSKYFFIPNKQGYKQPNEYYNKTGMYSLVLNAYICIANIVLF